MKKKGLLKIILIFLFSSLLHLPSQSQVHKYFIITGKIMTDSDCLKNCTIQITKNKKTPVLSQIPAHGRFRLELEYNTEYKLEFNTQGYRQKTVVVNTGVPENVFQNPENLPHFLMAVRLFKENHELTSLIQKITYSPEKNCFARIPGPYDIEYVEKDNPLEEPGIQSLINKTKIQGYQIF